MRISVLSSKASHCSGAYAPHVKGQLDLQKQKGKGPAHQWMLTAVVLAGCWLHMDPETNFCCRAAGSRLAVTLDPRSFRCRVPRGVRERRRQQDRSQDDGEARRLTAQITKAGSASELLALLEKPAKDAALFNSFHISAAMTKLARFKKRRQVGQADASSPVWATLSVRVSDMLEQDLLPPREAANVFYAAGELYQEMGKHMTKVLPLLCDSVHKKAAGMAEQALSNCLLAVVKLEDASPDVLTVVSALAMHIPAKVGAMTTQGMSNCLLAAAKLQDSSPEVLDIVPALAKFLPHKVGDMIPQALSNSLWAAAKLQDRAPEMLDAVPALVQHVRHKVEVGHMDPQGLSNCLWAAARLQDSVPKVLEAVPTIARRMQEIVDIMNMQDLSNNFWAVGELNAVEPEVLHWRQCSLDVSSPRSGD